MHKTIKIWILNLQDFASFVFSFYVTCCLSFVPFLLVKLVRALVKSFWSSCSTMTLSDLFITTTQFFWNETNQIFSRFQMANQLIMWINPWSRTFIGRPDQHMLLWHVFERRVKLGHNCSVYFSLKHRTGLGTHDLVNVAVCIWHHVGNPSPDVPSVAKSLRCVCVWLRPWNTCLFVCVDLWPGPHC